METLIYVASTKTTKKSQKKKNIIYAWHLYISFMESLINHHFRVYTSMYGIMSITCSIIVYNMESLIYSCCFNQWSPAFLPSGFIPTHWMFVDCPHVPTGRIFQQVTAGWCRRNSAKRAEDEPRLSVAEKGRWLCFGPKRLLVELGDLQDPKMEVL